MQAFRCGNQRSVFSDSDKLVGNAIKRAIKEGIVTREEIFVVSKLWLQDMTDEKTKNLFLLITAILSWVCECLLIV